MASRTRPRGRDRADPHRERIPGDPSRRRVCRRIHPLSAMATHPHASTPPLRRKSDYRERGHMTEHQSLATELPAISTFRDSKVCEQVRAIPRSEITKHHNSDFRIGVIDEPASFYEAFANDFVERIRLSRDAGEQLVAILPVGPVPQFEMAARIINEERISMRHVTTFNMDEYADQDGNTAPLSWPGSFQREMWRAFFSKIDSDLRPPKDQIHFPTSRSEERREGRESG